MAASAGVLKGTRYKPGAAFRVDWVRVDQPVPMAPWRSVGATQNGYFMECFVDEVAHAAGKDPYRLRRELPAHDARALKVVDTVAEAAGWGTPLPAGRARGMAFVESYGSLCAEVAEVSLREQVRIEQGRAVNTNFDQYRLVRISDAPERIDAIIIESGQPMGGVGEPPLPPIAPAIANAMFALTGKPARRMPLSEIDWS